MGGWKLERQPHGCTTTSSNTIIASHRVWAISFPPSCCTGTDRHSTAACRPGHASCSTRTLRAPNNIQTWCIAATPKHTCTTAHTHTHTHAGRRWEQRLIGPWQPPIHEAPASDIASIGASAADQRGGGVHAACKAGQPASLAHLQMALGSWEEGDCLEYLMPMSPPSPWTEFCTVFQLGRTDNAGPLSSSPGHST